MNKKLSDAQAQTLRRFCVDFCDTWVNGPELATMQSLEKLGALWSVPGTDVFVLTKQGYALAVTAGVFQVSQ